MRRSVPLERQDDFFCHFGDSSEVRRALQMQNRYLGLVCLVDPRGVVRWHVHGNEVPTSKEVGTLARLLTKEMAREGGKKAG